MTDNLSLHITFDLNQQILDTQTADGTVSKIKSVLTIDFHILIQVKHMQIELSNVHCLLELDTDLVSFSVIEEKKIEFYFMNGLLQIKVLDKVILYLSLLERILCTYSGNQKF